MVFFFATSRKAVIGVKQIWQRSKAAAKHQLGYIGLKQNFKNIIQSVYCIEVVRIKID